MRNLSYSKKRCTSGFTIIEVMIALLIATFVSIAFMGSILFLLKQNADNRRHLNAVTIASYYQGLLFAANPSKIGDPNISSSEFEAQFDHDEDDPITAYPDPYNPNDNESFKVYFDFTGFGKVASAEETSLTTTAASNQKAWKTNEWAGSYVTVNSTLDKAKSQVMRIVSNTGNTLTVTADLTGSTTDEGWQRIPTSDYVYHINNGRTIYLTVEWGDGEGYRKIQRTVILQR